MTVEPEGELSYKVCTPSKSATFNAMVKTKKREEKEWREREKRTKRKKRKEGKAGKKIFFFKKKKDTDERDGWIEAIQEQVNVTKKKWDERYRSQKSGGGSHGVLTDRLEMLSVKKKKQTNV